MGKRWKGEEENGKDIEKKGWRGKGQKKGTKGMKNNDKKEKTQHREKTRTGIENIEKKRGLLHKGWLK